MDRSLDEIIGDRPQRQPRGGGRRGEGRRPQPARAPRREEYPRDGVRKYRRDEQPAMNIESDWVHDRFEDDEYERPMRRPEYDDRGGYGARNEPIEGAKIRVENIHYELSESDIRGLFQEVGPTISVKLLYDRAGRSEGIAFVVYEDSRDAHRAIQKFNNQNANGQPIHLTLVPNGPRPPRQGLGPSMFDRMQPRSRPLAERIEGGNSGRRRQRSDSPRRSDVTGPAPENVDRYVPGRGSRSPIRRRGTPRGGREQGRRPGQRGERKPRADDAGRSLVGGRPRKTAEEMDAEMDDYFGKQNGEDQAQDGGVATDDIDMVT